MFVVVFFFFFLFYIFKKKKQLYFQKKKEEGFVLCGVLCVFFLVSILFVKKEKEKLFP
jgi:hypothetical protein